MSWASWLIIGMIGFTSFVAAVVISAIIVLAISEAAVLAYQGAGKARKSEAGHGLEVRL